MNLKSRPGRRPYTWLPVLIIVMVVVALGIGAVVLRYIKARLTATAGETLALAASDIAGKLDILLAERHGDILMMAQAGAVLEHDIEAMTSYFNKLREAYPVYAWIGATDAQGRIIAATNPDSIGKDRSQTPWFRAARDGIAVHVTDAEVSEESAGILAVSFTAPIRGARGEFLGAVTTRVGIHVLEDIFGQTVGNLKTQHGTEATIEYQFLNRSGDLIADSMLREEGQVNLKLLGLPSALFAGSAQPGYVEELHLRRHAPVITGYAQTEGLGEFTGFHWGILVRMDRSEVLAPIRRTVTTLAMVGSLTLLPVVGFLFWTTGRLKKEWGQAQDEAARARTAEATAHERSTAFHGLVEAVREISAAESDIERFLRNLTEAACRLTGARYGASGVFDKEGTRLAPLITVGIDEQTRAAIGDLPSGQGLLGALAHETQPLRLTDCTQHPAFVGFPPHHPPMRSFLGLSVRAHGRLFGRLYLTDKLGPGGEVIAFTELDEQVVAAFTAQAGVAIENARLLQDMRRTEEALRASNKELENFVYAVSHDLKTPLRGIHGFADLLLKRTKDRLEGRELHYVERIKAGTQRMADLVNDLLEYSRIERVTHPFQEVSAEAVLVQVLADLKDLIRRNRLVLSCKGPLPVVWADPVRLGQVWTNLLTNAIKFVEPGKPPRITIRCKEEPREFVFSVEDNGIGIHPEFHTRIFGLFHRLHTPETYEGTGVGLAIVKRIVELHKGRIWVESAEGQGSTFFFTIPKTSVSGDHA